MSKHVLITGASSGIGKALCEYYLNAGDTVIAVARSKDVLEKFAKNNTNFSYLVCDLTDSQAVDEARFLLQSRYKSLDLIIANAGNCLYMDMEMNNWEELYRNVFDVNVMGLLNTLSLTVDLLKKSNSPQFVAISSMVELYAFTRAEVYGGSKAAVSYIMKCLAVDLKPLDIEVSTIYPGFVKTPLTEKNDFDMPFILEASIAAQRIGQAIKNRKRQYYFPKRLYLTLKMLSVLSFFGYRPNSLGHKSTL